MRLWYRRASIDTDLRQTFEEYGVGGMQALLASQKHFRHGGSLTSTDEPVLTPLRQWLKEQYDRVDVVETWSIVMEAGIVVFVLFEVLFDFGVLHRH
jgi:hypothetical protein